MSERLLVIGLDGYDPAIASALMRAGALPHLRALQARSAMVMLDHGDARRTGLAWEHFATGLAPEAAGRFSAVDFDVDRYTCVQRGTTLAPFTAGLDARAVVFDAPYFDLNRAGRTQGIVGWGAHDPGVPLQSNPRGLSAQLQTRFGPYPAQRWIYGHTWPSAARTREMGHRLAQAVDVRAAAAEWLLNERITDWTLGIVVVSELHSAVEALYHGLDPDHPLAGLPSAEPARDGMHAVYAATDALVGRLTRCMPDAAVLVFSMHGMGCNESDVTSMALLPELLYRMCFGEPLLKGDDSCVDVESGLVMPPENEAWTDSMRRYFGQPGASTDRPPALSALWRRGRRLLRRGIRRWVPPGPTTNSLSWMPAAWYAPHWPRMRAFALPSFYDGQIRINLKGRERSGCVAMQDYANTLDEIERILTACIDPATGERVVREVIRTDARSAATLGPTQADMIVVWAGAAAAIEHPALGRIGPLPYRRPGGHTGGHGVALLSGAGARPGDHGVRSAFDVTPTIIELVTGRPPDASSGHSFVAAARDVM